MNHSKNKRGVSIMVGYILLVVFVVVISALVYGWLVTYVPTEPLNCPDGVSVFVKDAVFDSSTSQLNLTLKNSGRFNFAGYFIHAKTSSSQELATTDLSGYLDESFGGVKFGNAVLFVASGNNALTPNDEKTNIFNLDLGAETPYSVRIIPTRFQIEDNRERFVSCGDSKVEQIVGGPIVECVPEGISVTCGSFVCGDKVNNCGNVVSCPPGCSGTDVCNATGICVPPAQCNDNCTSSGYECGTWTICGTSVDCAAETGSCASGFSCNVTGQCVSTVGNGICDAGETCADEPLACEDQQAQCAIGETCQSGSCVFNAGGSFNSCGDYCALFGYAQIFACQDNPNKCAPPQGPEGGTYIGDVSGANETYGDSFCLGDSYCCCQP